MARTPYNPRAGNTRRRNILAALQGKQPFDVRAAHSQRAQRLPRVGTGATPASTLALKNPPVPRDVVIGPKAPDQRVRSEFSRRYDINPNAGQAQKQSRRNYVASLVGPDRSALQEAQGASAKRLGNLVDRRRDLRSQLYSDDKTVPETRAAALKAQLAQLRESLRPILSQRRDYLEELSEGDLRYNRGVNGSSRQVGRSMAPGVPEPQSTRRNAVSNRRRRSRQAQRLGWTARERNL